jgi:RND family efflux transporter MFP subunit
VRQARSGFEKRKRDYARIESLYSDSVVTLEQLQDSETALTVARSQLDIAEFNLQHAKISAPSSGTVLKRLVERGELVAQGHPVYIFGSGQDDWRVKAGLTDREVIRIESNDSCRVSFDAYPDRFFTARVVEISGAPDPVTGTYKVELSLRAPGYRLMQGFFARIAIYPSRRKKYLTVPFSSLVEADGSRGYIFTPVADGRVKKIPVTIDFISEDLIAVENGLEGVTSVITEGAPYLTDNSRVKIVQSDNSSEGVR